MSERLSKAVLIIVAGVLLLPMLGYFAYSRPGTFASPMFLLGILGLEVTLAAAWLYRRMFLPLVLVVFLLAGVDLPVGTVWTAARWFFLGVGALVGCFVMLKEREHHFRLFHALAILSILAALVSSAVSRYPSFALMKAASLAFLFVYVGTGARLAASGREERFLAGLLLAAEIFVVAVAVFYVAGFEAMGNPNSLGAVMSVFAAPVLLWGTLLDDNPIVHHRRIVLFGLAAYLTFHSHSRAALVSAFLACSLLCLALRKYKLFVQGIVVILIVTTSVAIFDPDAFSRTVSSLTASVVYKDKDAALGVLASRESPWQNVIQSIRGHFWFGSGFGTTDNGMDASADLGKFSTTAATTSENGSSYLSILSWVGMLGVLPFAFLLLSVVAKIARTSLWMLNTGSPYHVAVPLAMVAFAGIIHAIFEDWMFAPGYYLCVFFWAMAFILTDYAPWAPLPSFQHSWRPWLLRPRMQATAPVR